jgi:hypothetical protein
MYSQSAGWWEADMANPGPARASKRRWLGYLGAVAIGAILTLAAVAILNGGPLLISHPPVLGSVQLKGIQASFTYSGSRWHVFGAEQDSCSSCPMLISGGSLVTFSNIVDVYNVANASLSVLINATSQIPFQEWRCDPIPAGGCPFSTQSADGVELTCGTGALVDWSLSIAVPNPAPLPLVGGWTFHVTANVTEGSCPG